MRTFPAITTTSKVRPNSRCGSVRSASTHSSAGALRRAASSIAASTSTPTTSRPRRLSSMATRPVPQPASRTRPGAVGVDEVGLAVHVDAGRCQAVRSGGRRPRRAGRRCPASGRSLRYGIDAPPGSVCGRRPGRQGEQAGRWLRHVLGQLEVVALRGARVRQQALLGHAVLAGPLAGAVTVIQVEDWPPKLPDDADTWTPSARASDAVLRLREGGERDRRG